jgi:DNA-binding transcriptional MerR regulator
MPQKLISSQDIVEKFNLPYTTVTHYTNLGFFTVVKKKGNKRLYDEDKVRMNLKKITALASEGYPLRLIRKKLIG